MTIYGYTKVNSDGIDTLDVRESKTQLFLSEDTRNEVMYQDYSDSFDMMEETSALKLNNQAIMVDYCGAPKMSKQEFMKAAKRPDAETTSVAACIQLEDYHIQFEPFRQEI